LAVIPVHEDEADDYGELAMIGMGELKHVEE
jgi:hypothetical protein